MALLTVQQISKSGIADLDSALTAAASGGDSVVASSGIVIVVKNADASPHTLTLTRPAATAECGELGTLAVADITLVVAAADTGVVTIPQGYAANNLFSWTYDAVTSVTVGVFSLAP